MKKTIGRGLAATSTIALGAVLAMGTSAPAYAVETWTISGLTLNAPIVIDVDATTGDDGGLLAVTQKYVEINNEDNGHTYDLTSLTPQAVTDVETDTADYALVSDLKTNKAYQVYLPGTVNTLTELDVDGNLTSNVITLSSAIDINNGDWVIMSGFGWIGVWNYTNNGYFYTIDPTDGTVTAVSAGTNKSDDYSLGIANYSEGSDWLDGAGVGEFDGTNYWYVATDDNGGISEWQITGSAVTNELLNNVDGQSDSDTFIISTCSDRFYIHTENNDGDDGWTSYFGQDITDMAEPLLSADATFSSAGECPAEDGGASLADTGINAGMGIAAFATLVGLGLASVVIARRRAAAAK